MIDENKLIEELETLKAKTIIFKSDLIFNDAINTVIKKVNEQQKINEWIPVEERLPKEHEIVLVAYLEYISNTKQLCEIAYINEYRTWSWYFNGTVVRNKIIAWMPLPKPYGGNEND